MSCWITFPTSRRSIPTWNRLRSHPDSAARNNSPRPRPSSIAERTFAGRHPILTFLVAPIPSAVAFIAATLLVLALVYLADSR